PLKRGPRRCGQGREAIQSAVASSIAWRTCSSLRPLLARTWKAWSASSKSTSVARALQKEHRAMDIGKMLRALERWLACGMQRKADEDEAANAGQRLLGLRLGGHAPAERLAAGEERQPGALRRRLGDGGAHGGMRHGGRVGAPRTLLPVRGRVAASRGG